MCEDELRVSLRPLYVDLLSLVTRSRGGLQLLVDIRSDLLVSIIYNYEQSSIIMVVQ